MEIVVAAIATVVGNTVWGLLRAVAKDIRGLEFGPLSQADRESLRRIVEAECDAAGGGDLAVLVDYFERPDFRTYVHHAAALELAGELDSGAEDLLGRMFSQGIAAATRSYDLLFELDQDVVAHLHGACLGSIRHQIESLRRRNPKHSHELVLQSQTTSIIALLKAINTNVEMLAATSEDSIASFELALDRYLTGCITAHSRITPPNFGNARRVDLEDLFVEPRIVSSGDGRANSDPPSDVAGFLERLDRAVLLGDPGGGKSTVCIWATLQRAKQAKASQESRIPIHVVLRDLGTSESGSIIDFIRADFRSRYQVDPVPDGLVAWILASGRAVVFFDGLDELLETASRARIVRSVEVFAAQYPTTPILCTGRRVGYSEVPLSQAEFPIFELDELGVEQVREYAHKWFALDEALLAADSEALAESFFTESEVVPDLRVNPLILALMCNIYRAENYIPKNRPDVYEKCALMLFDRWDKGRDIRVELPFEEHVRPTMQHLAFWIYQAQYRQSGVSEEALVQETASYLVGRRFDTSEEAEAAAREFVEFCRGRAWVFSEAGSTADGQGLYQFTHRTFLEYFTAAHLVRTRNTPAGVLKFLRNKIKRAEWDVVSQLAFQMTARRHDNGAKEILGGLLEYARQHEELGARLNFASFMIRSLGFLVPPPSVVRDIAEFGADAYLKQAVASEEVRDEDAGHSLALADLYEVGAENRTVMIETVSRVLDPAVQESPVAKDCAMGLLLTRRGRPDSLQREYLDQLPQSILEEAWESPTQEGRALWPVVWAYHNRDVDLEELLTRFPPEAYFAHQPVSGVAGFVYLALDFFVVRQLVFSDPGPVLRVTPVEELPTLVRHLFERGVDVEFVPDKLNDMPVHMGERAPQELERQIMEALGPDGLDRLAVVVARRLAVSNLQMARPEFEKFAAADWRILEEFRPAIVGALDLDGDLGAAADPDGLPPRLASWVADKIAEALGPDN